MNEDDLLAYLRERDERGERRRSGRIGLAVATVILTVVG